MMKSILKKHALATLAALPLAFGGLASAEDFVVGDDTKPSGNSWAIGEETLTFGTISVGAGQGSSANFLHLGNSTVSAEKVSVGAGRDSLSNHLYMSGGTMAAGGIDLGSGQGSSTAIFSIADGATLEVYGDISLGAGDGAGDSRLWIGVDSTTTVEGNLLIGASENAAGNQVELLSGGTLTVGTIHLGTGKGSVYNALTIENTSRVLADAVYFGHANGGTNYFASSDDGYMEVKHFGIALNSDSIIAGDLRITQTLYVIINGGGIGEYTQFGITDLGIGTERILFGEGMGLALDINGMFELEVGMTFGIVTGGLVNESLALQDGMTFVSGGWKWMAISPGDGTFSMQALQQIQQVPEPSAWLLLGAGAAFVVVMRRRKGKA